MSKIHTLGPNGSYSSKAAKKVNAELNFEIEYNNNIASVIGKTSEGFYGIIPMHNTYGGIVEDSLEHMLKHKHILQTLLFSKLRIEHCLASFHGEYITDIRTVYSHPQAIKQCESYLNRINAICVPTSSTSEKVTGLRYGEGVICSKDIARELGLAILKEDISPDDNMTIFALISNGKYGQIFKERFQESIII